MGCVVLIRPITVLVVSSTLLAWVPVRAESFTPERLADDTCTMMQDPAVPESIKTQTKQNVDRLLKQESRRDDYKQIQRGYQLARSRGCV